MASVRWAGMAVLFLTFRWKIKYRPSVRNYSFILSHPKYKSWFIFWYPQQSFVLSTCEMRGWINTRPNVKRRCLRILIHCLGTSSWHLVGQYPPTLKYKAGGVNHDLCASYDIHWFARRCGFTGDKHHTINSRMAFGKRHVFFWWLNYCSCISMRNKYTLRINMIHLHQSSFFNVCEPRSTNNMFWRPCSIRPPHRSRWSSYSTKWVTRPGTSRSYARGKASIEALSYV